MANWPADVWADDGLVAIASLAGDLEVSVEVVAQQHRNPLGPPVEVWRERPVSLASLGRRNRAMLLAQAVCRFLDSGGELAEARELLQRFGQVPLSRVFEGFTLVDAGVDEDGQFIRVYLADDRSLGVWWTEGSHIDVLTPRDAGIALHDAARRREAYTIEWSREVPPAISRTIEELQADETVADAGPESGSAGTGESDDRPEGPAAGWGP